MPSPPAPEAFRHLLAIAATPFEAEPLLRELANRHAVRVGPYDATTGTVAGIDMTVAALGVGKTNTAAGLTRLATQLDVSSVVQIGVGGTYAGSFLAVGGVAVAGVEVDLDLGVALRVAPSVAPGAAPGLASADGWRGVDALGFPVIRSMRGAGTPETEAASPSNASASTPPNAEAPSGNHVPTNPALTRWLSHGGRIPVVAFGTSDAVSGDLETAALRHARFDLGVESMEGAAAAQTATLLGLPFAEVRGISNVAGQRDKVSWELPTAARAAAEVLLGALRDRQ